MKVNKKAVLCSAVILGAAALIAGGTIAYFTDSDNADNHFTVGDVDITIYESQLHRQNSGRGGNFPGLASDPDYCDWVASVNVPTSYGNSSLINGSYENARYCTPGHDISANSGASISAVVNGHTKASRNWGYTDEEIEDDAETYKATDDATTGVDESGYFTRVSQNIVPGQWVRKFTYVKNEDQSSDAYVLIRYMVPTDYADLIDVKVPGTPFEEDTSDVAGHQGYFTAVTKDVNGYTAFDASTADAMDNYTGYTETIGGIEYKIYAAVTTVALKPGEMTYWSPVNTVRLNKNAQNSDPNGANYVSADELDIKVDAQAIQAKTFSNAIEAINQL